MGLGETLKTEREKQGFNLETIEEETKIRKLYLQAIENEQFDSLPPRVYSVGFVKRYAKFLGLNEKELSQEFQNLAYGEEVQEEIVFPHEPNRSLPLKNIGAAVIFLLIVIWVGNYLVDFFSDNVSQPPANPPIAQQPEENPQEEPGAAEDNEPPAVTPGTVALLLQATQDCWVSVSVNGQIIFAETLAAGEEKLFEENSTVYLTLGNAGGIDVTYNGQKLDPLGKDWEVVKNIEFKVAE